jgi:activator of HSP90 ATPase
MPATVFSRRALAQGLAAMPLATTLTAALAQADPKSGAAKEEGLTHAAAIIHQEVVFSASRERLYRALVTSAQFDAITRLSDGAELLAAPGAKPTSISGEPGGPFTLFGGYVTGRHLEMVPNERLVQAWRAGSWPPGDYSIVRFALTAIGADTRLVFDHRGFPDSQGSSLAYGWRVHYWEPLAKFLAQK